MINELSKILSKQYQIMGKFSSIPVYKALKKNKDWKLVNNNIETTGAGILKDRKTLRKKVKWWSFQYINLIKG